MMMQSPANSLALTTLMPGWLDRSRQGIFTRILGREKKYSF
jgi:hypothetical protein